MKREDDILDPSQIDKFKNGSGELLAKIRLTSRAFSFILPAWT
jgi:hypothetical protein